MRLREVGIRHFRNLAVQELEIPPEGFALIGENAQGKSNFLEAVYYLETFRSFRGAPDEQLVAVGQEAFRVTGALAEAADQRRVTAAYQPRGKRKKVTVDGAEVDRLGDALGSLAAVIFSPADVELVSGGPAERRRYLDIVLSLNVPGYVRALQQYRHVLAQRNAALRDAARAGGAGGAAVRPWDDGLVRWGARLVMERRQWIEERCGLFRTLYEAVAADGQGAGLRYEPGVPLEGATGEDDVAAAFREALAVPRTAERELRVGSTVVGPHRDDLLVTLEGGAGRLEARAFGSGGQRRTAALALRLLEARTIRDRRRRSPLVLVDDVFAELDEGRSERALDLLEREETGQVILTAPKASDIRLKRDALPRWRIAAGRIET
jgi:DNA replication and repair protein RecF